MSARATVVLRAPAETVGDDWLVPVARALDLQTLAPGDFEVIAVAAPGTPVAARLADLAARRTNVRVVDPDADPVALARGEWYLDLGADVHRHRPALQPGALAALVEAGDRAGADVVLGRTVAAGRLVALDALVPGEAPAAAEALQGLLAAQPTGDLRPLVLTRTKSLVGGAAPAAASVLALAAPVCATTVLDRTSGSTGTVTVSDVSGTWSAGVLTVRARVAAPAAHADQADQTARTGQADQADQAARVVLGVRDGRTGLEYFLATRTSSEGDVLTVEADLDVRTAAAGEPLPVAHWDVTVGVHGNGAASAARTVVPPPAAARPGPALVDGLAVAPTADSTVFRLDVGGRETSVVGVVDPAEADITESARGTLLVLRLPHVHAAGDSRVRGQLRLGTFGIPADLAVTDGAARLECWLTGLAGTSNLSVVFGGAPKPTGLTLEIDEVGVMSVRRTPPKAPAEPKPAAKPTRVVPPPSNALAARVRRAVRQTPLEPAVRRVRRNPLARGIYRSLIRKG